jgi:hypothetical protein
MVPIWCREVRLEWREVGEETDSRRWKRNDMALLFIFFTLSPEIGGDALGIRARTVPSATEGLKMEKFLMSGW